jgi:DNA-binding MarR family transcriptional regulator
MSMNRPTVRATTASTSLPPVDRRLTPLARRFNQVCNAAAAEVFDSHGLVPLQFGVLANLDEKPGIDQRMLADRLAIDRTNAGLLVDQLEAMGLVERYLDPDDRRVRLLRLTDAGQGAFRDSLPGIVEANRAVLASALSAHEAGLFMDMLVRIVVANEYLAKPGLGRRKRRPSAANRTDQINPARE